MEYRKWSCALIFANTAFFGGTFYSFPVWATDLKDHENYNQVDINTIGGGAYLGLVGVALFGFLISLGYVSPRWIALLSLSLNSISYALMFVFTWFAPQPSLLVAFALFLVGAGAGGSFTALYPLTATYFNQRLQNIISSLGVILYSLTGFLASLFYYLAPLSSEVKMEVLMLVPGIGCAGLVVWGLFALYPADSQLTQVIGAEEEHFLPDNATENITPDTGSMKFGSSHPALNIHRDGNPGCMGNLRAQFSAIITLRFAVLFAVLSIAFGTAINFYNNAGSMARTFRMNRDEESVLILVFSGVLLASRFLTGALLALFNPFYYQSRLLAVGVTLFLMFGISVAGKYIFNTHPNVSKILRLMLVFLSEQ